MKYNKKGIWSLKEKKERRKERRRERNKRHCCEYLFTFKEGNSSFAILSLFMDNWPGLLLSTLSSLDASEDY